MRARYEQIARELELELRQSTGLRRLPTEAALCERFGCSRQTVRSALKLLAERGLIVRRQGSGSYPTRSVRRTGRQIAVLIPGREEYLCPALLREIRRAAGEAGFSVLCLETGGSREREREQLSALLERRPAGLILEPITDIVGCFSDDLLEALQAAEVPLVYLNGRYAPEAPAVLTDDEGGAGLLMTHLASEGHRNIAGVLKWDDSRGIRRFRGCVRAAGELGVRFEDRSCLWFSEQERLALLEGDETLLRRFHRTHRRDCTAVVCQNDEIAYRLARFLRTEQSPMAVVSFDNSYLAREGALTSLGLEDGQPGTEAVSALLQQLEGRHPTPAPLPWTLRQRRSG